MSIVGQYSIYFILAIILSTFSGIIIYLITRAYEIKKKLKKELKIFSKENIFSIKYNVLKVSIYILISMLSYFGIVYYLGSVTKLSTYESKLYLFEYFFTMLILISVFIIDIKQRIIPNRVNMTFFHIATLFTVLHALNGNSMLKERVLGMLIAFAIFAIMIIVGYLFSGKEAMGIGDLKFMIPIGLIYRGMKVLDITLIAFFISAIVSVFVLIIRKIRGIHDDYVPFGPFLVLGVIIVTYLPSGAIFNMFLQMTNKISSYVI